MISDFEKSPDPKIIKSFGIALCRYNSAQHCYEVLMAKRRTSYEFADFLYGKYNVHGYDEEEIISLFNSMTSTEKSILGSGDFGTMWCLMMGVNPEPGGDSNYKKYKKIFYERWPKLFILRHLLGKSKDCGECWEIPKGWSVGDELACDTALREFYEETQISSRHFSLTPYEVHVQYVSAGSTYMLKYFIAIYTRGYKNPPRIDYNSKQTREVVELRWLSRRVVDAFGGPVLRQITNEICSIVKKNKLCKIPTSDIGTKLSTFRAWL